MAIIDTTIARPGEAASANGPSADEVRAALARLLRQPPLLRSRQLTAFLTYVVETALAGRAATIKSYTIACDALGRDPSFDPQTDPIVRVEAGRLRRILDAYYRGEGAADPVRIEVPRGRYVPHFSLNAPVAAPAVAAVTATAAQPDTTARRSLGAIAIGIVSGFAAGLGLLVSDIGAMERITLIAALLMGLDVLIRGGQAKRETPDLIGHDVGETDGVATARAVAPIRRIAAPGVAARH